MKKTNEENGVISLASFRNSKKAKAQKELDSMNKSAAKKIAVPPPSSTRTVTSHELLGKLINHYEYIQTNKSMSFLDVNYLDIQPTGIPIDELFTLGDSVSLIMDFDLQNPATLNTGIYAYLKSLKIKLLYQCKEDWMKDNVCIEIKDRDNIIFYLNIEDTEIIAGLNLIIYLGIYIIHTKLGTTGFGLVPIPAKPSSILKSKYKDILIEALYFALGFLVNTTMFKQDMIDKLNPVDLCKKYFIDLSTLTVLTEFYNNYVFKK